MKQNHFIRDAIDESLSGVHFDAKDARSVLRAVSNREELPERRPEKKAHWQFALAMAMTLIVMVPIGLFTLRAQHTGTTRISAAPGTQTAMPAATTDPHADLIVSATAAPSYSADEDEAIRIARQCFEAVCDTGIFTFEEYAVSVSSDDPAGLTVTMTCIYGNGCTFSVLVSPADGSVLSHSTPELATKPVYLDASAPEIQAWYDKYGPHLMTWPQDAQAEFSRRYEGAALRSALPGELSAQEAAELAETYVRKYMDVQDGIVLFCYPMLCAEQASGDGAARYIVSCFVQEVTDTLPEAFATVSFRTDGSGATAALN